MFSNPFTLRFLHTQNLVLFLKVSITHIEICNFKDKVLFFHSFPFKSNFQVFIFLHSPFIIFLIILVSFIRTLPFFLDNLNRESL